MNIPIILFVDDEPNILKTLRRLFMDEDYDIHTANNGREALDLIKAGLKPTIIISDQRMPEMAGDEFLAKASELVPDSIRMVLTGYADINAAVSAINLGGIYRYILKPWNDDDLKMTVRKALVHFNLVAENRALTQELENKNKSLAQMNEQLEAMVKARTQELHQKIHELEGRDTIQQYLLRVHPLDELLKTVLTVVVDVCGLDGAAYYAVDHDNAFERLALHPPLEGNASGYDDGGVTAQIASRLPLLRMAVEDGAVGDTQTFDHEHAIYSLTPVATGSNFFGVLLGRRPPHRPFTDAEMATLMSFAMQAAIGINDCHIHDHYDDIQTSLDDVLSKIGEV